MWSSGLVSVFSDEIVSDFMGIDVLTKPFKPVSDMGGVQFCLIVIRVSESEKTILLMLIAFEHDPMGPYPSLIMTTGKTLAAAECLPFLYIRVFAEGHLHPVADANPAC